LKDFHNIHAVHKSDFNSLRCFGTEGGACIELDRNYGVSYMLDKLDTSTLSHEQLKNSIEDIKNYKPNKIYYRLFK
jgi:hypothetical protein